MSQKRKDLRKMGEFEVIFWTISVLFSGNKQEMGVQCCARSVIVVQRFFLFVNFLIGDILLF